MKLSATRLTSMAQAGGKSAIQRAIAVLRKFGTDAHVWLPGVGALNGLTAGNYLDSAGTTAGTVDNPVGLVLDGMGVTITPAVGDFGVPLAYDNTLSGVTSSGFSTTAGASNARVYVNLQTAVGSTYTIKGVVGVASTTAVTIYSRTGFSGAGLVLTSVGATPGATFILTFTATSTTSCFLFAGNTAGQSFSVSGLSIITGIPATQATTANKPILRRGLKNLLTWSNDFSNAAWIKQSGVSAVGNVISGATALGWDAAGTMQRSISVPSSTSYTYTVKIRSSGATTATIRLRDGTTGAISDTVIPLTADLTTAVVSKTSGASSTSFGMLMGAADGDVFMEAAALFQGTYTAEEIIAQGGIPVTTTAPASNPTAGKYWWDFDGVNDSLQLSAVPFQMSDDHCVIAGGKFLDTVGNYCFAEQGSALIGLRAIGGKAGAVWYDNGAAHLVDLRGTTTLTSAPCVISMRSGASVQIIRLNSVTEKSAFRPAFGASTLSSATVGSNLSASYMNGAIYPVIAIKGTVSDAELLLLEKLVASLSGITL